MSEMMLAEKEPQMLDREKTGECLLCHKVYPLFRVYATGGEHSTEGRGVIPAFSPGPEEGTLVCLACAASQVKICPRCGTEYSINVGFFPLSNSRWGKICWPCELEMRGMLTIQKFVDETVDETIDDMEAFISEMSPEGFDRLPPKVWRAVMLWLYGLPVTNYLIRDIWNSSFQELCDLLRERLARSPAGIVLRAVTYKTIAPYFWIHDASEIHDAVRHIFDSSQRYIIALAPMALPQNAESFTVGRYEIRSDGSRILEVVPGVIQPRSIEMVSSTSPKHVVMTMKAGQPFQCVKGDPKLCQPIISALLRYENNLMMLWDLIGGPHICIEFTYQVRKDRIEMHDFD